MANAQPTVADLIAELKSAERISQATITSFSDEFVNGRQFAYNNLSQWFLMGLANHSRGHFTQISDAIKAAREA